MLKLRGIIQTHVTGQSFTPTEVAKIYVANHDKLFDELTKFRRTMAGLKGVETAKKNKNLQDTRTF